MRRNSTFGVRGAGAFEHDGSDPISSIGDADGDTYVDTDTVGDGSADIVRVVCNGATSGTFAASYTDSRHVFIVNEGAPLQVLRARGVSIAKTTAPDRGVVSRDNICFAWGRVFVDITANSTNLSDAHNVDTAAYVSDSIVTVTYHNAASSNIAAILLSTSSSGDQLYSVSFSTTGFSLRFGGTPSANWYGHFAVFTKDLT